MSIYDPFSVSRRDELVIERPQANRPHQGKVLAAIQAHADDIPLFCAGTVAKLLQEGYTGYLIQTTNDEKCGPTRSLGETGATQAVVANDVTAPVYIVELIKSDAFYTAGLACIVLIIVSYVAMLGLRYVTNSRRSR